MSRRTKVQIVAWGLAAIASILAVSVWASERLDGRLSAYDVFPLFGMLAFSLMWTHYITGAVRRYFRQPKEVVQSYSVATGAVVLALLFLHPVILIASLKRDGFGLPPASYLAVYPETMQGVIMLGTVSLLIFLSFELKQWLNEKSWWYMVEYLQLLAMALIFYHGLTLGRELSVGWYRMVWWFYGVSFLVSVVYNYTYDKWRKDGAK